jgi:S1-C subfamily serine protease
MVLAVSIVSKREFAQLGIHVDEAIFTSPAHPAWSGAALINREGKVVGVSSLIVGDAKGTGDKTTDNLFVPAERLMPILGDSSQTASIRSRPPGSASARTKSTAADGEPRHARQPGVKADCAAATSSSASTARIRRRSSTSIARSGAGRRRRPSRSTCCKATRSTVSTSRRSTGSMLAQVVSDLRA